MCEFITILVIIALVANCNGTPTQSHTDARIIGGVYAEEFYAPHMVALLNGNRPMCGASIVSRCHVLTAAHCVTPVVQDGKLISTFHGRVGSLKWGSGGITIYFTKYYIHPKYNSDTLKYDVAILVVREGFEWSKSIGVIGLEYKWVEVESCYVTGWGRTGPRITDISIDLSPTPDYLQHIYVNTIPSEQCITDMRKALENNNYVHEIPEVHPHVEICTFHSHGHGMCHGDSGSALVSRKTGRQVGVVSWGMPCAAGAPDIFVRVNGTGDFIKPIIKRCDC